ncbi:M48 family metalloprotease [candidate division KSB1 bacterium]
MKCPKCKEKDMLPTLTKQGVEVDRCPDCKGIWLDKGEIFYFSKKPAEIQRELSKAIPQSTPSERICPRTGENMKEIKLLKDKLTLDYSPSSGGIWFDDRELKKLITYFGDKFKLSIDKGTELLEEKIPPAPVFLPSLPNLFIRSVSVLVMLYGLLTIGLIALTIFTDVPPIAALFLGIAIATFQFLLGPYITDISLGWFYKMSWIKYEDLPVFLRDFITITCGNKNMENPRMGIIDDSAPNAFTYGHTPNNARIVITKGLMDLLNEDEVEAVVAHEIGHAKHWDMLIMTAAQLVPLILYYIYRTLIRLRTKKNDRLEVPRLAIAIGAYVLYIISEYIVLWLSRAREYYADRFAGEITQNPNSLARGLVKIGYGLAGKESERKKEEKKRKEKEEDEDDERQPSLEAVGALGIFDPKSGLALAVSSVSSVAAAKKMGDKIDKEILKGAMKWDLWNPWAKYYEINSTHPLIAGRINQLSKQSEVLGEEPYVRFDKRKPESYWDEFFMDLFIKILPALAVIPFLFLYVTTKEVENIALGLVAVGVAYFIKTIFSYKSEIFPEMSISSLLKKVKVSGVRPVPCAVTGKIIGRGIPGLIWSEDFVLQDGSGIIFLDYRQPIPFWDFFFGLLRGKRYRYKKAKITGWYRRSPVPYIELKSIKAEGEVEGNCYTYMAKYVWAGILVAVGLILMLREIQLF